MELSPAQFAHIEPYLPRQRGSVSLYNIGVLNAILYVAQHGCKWRGLPERFGNWHTIYTRMNRWAKAGVLDRMFEQLQRAQVVRIRGGWSTKLHLVAASDRFAVAFTLSACQAANAVVARDWLRAMGPTPRALPMLTDRAYKGNDMRSLVRELGFGPVVPPKRTRRQPWDYDQVLYRRRNEIERLFRRLKSFRRVFTRFDKFDVLYRAFVRVALIVHALRQC